MVVVVLEVVVVVVRGGELVVVQAAAAIIVDLFNDRLVTFYKRFNWNVIVNDALHTFYLWLERGNLLLSLHGLLFFY